MRSMWGLCGVCVVSAWALPGFFVVRWYLHNDYDHDDYPDNHHCDSDQDDHPRCGVVHCICRW